MSVFSLLPGIHHRVYTSNINLTMMLAIILKLFQLIGELGDQQG